MFCRIWKTCVHHLFLSWLVCCYLFARNFCDGLGHFSKIYLLPHLGWIAARAHTGWIGPIGPPRNIGKILEYFWIFQVHWKHGLRWPHMGPGGFLFLLIQTLPTFWAEQIWILRINIFFIVLTPQFWISRSPDLQISGFPGPQISKFPDSQVLSKFFSVLWEL